MFFKVLLLQKKKKIRYVISSQTREINLRQQQPLTTAITSTLFMYNKSKQPHIRVQAQMDRGCRPIDDSKWLGPICVSAVRNRTPVGAAPGGSADLFQDPSITWSKLALRSHPTPPPPTTITMETVRSSLMCQEPSTLLIRLEAEPKLKRTRACRQWREGDTSKS